MPITGTWVQSFDVDANDQVWIGDGFGQIFRRTQNGTWESFGQSNSILNFHYSRDIYTDLNGVTWASGFNYNTQESYLYRFVNETWELVRTSDNVYYAYSMIMNEAGELWLNNTSSIQKFNGEDWTTYTHEDIPSLQQSGFIRTLALDSENNLWVGASSGISVLLENPVSTGIVGSNELDADIHIYPNPSTDVVSINLRLERAEALSMQLIDLSGQEIRSIVEGHWYGVGDHEIEISIGDPGGMYLLKIRNNQGQLQVKPIVIID